MRQKKETLHQSRIPAGSVDDLVVLPMRYLHGGSVTWQDGSMVVMFRHVQLTIAPRNTALVLRWYFTGRIIPSHGELVPYRAYVRYLGTVFCLSRRESQL